LDAGSSDVVTALATLGGYIIGVDVNYGYATPQMTQLAQDTNSYADIDGDGVADEELVFSWSGSSTDFRNTISSAVEQLVGSIVFERVHLEVDGDDNGFVTDIQPEFYDNIDPDLGAQELSFTLSFLGTVAATTEDQFFILTLNVIGDETTLLDSYEIMVVVPGTSY